MADETEHPDGEPGGEAPADSERESLATTVGREVRKVLGTLLGSGELEVGEEGTTGAEPIETPAEPSSPRQVEADTEDAVRAALDKLRGEEEHKKEHERIKEAERPPMVVNRLTRAMWGEP